MALHTVEPEIILKSNLHAIFASSFSFLFRYFYMILNLQKFKGRVSISAQKYRTYWPAIVSEAVARKEISLMNFKEKEINDKFRSTELMIDFGLISVGRIGTSLFSALARAGGRARADCCRRRWGAARLRESA